MEGQGEGRGIPRLPRTLVWLSSSCSVHRRQQGKLQPYPVIDQRVLVRQAISAIPQAGKSFRLHTNHPPRGGIPSAPPCASLSPKAWVTTIEHPNGRGRPTGRFPGPCFSAKDEIWHPHICVRYHTGGPHSSVPGCASEAQHRGAHHRSEGHPSQVRRLRTAAIPRSAAGRRGAAGSRQRRGVEDCILCHRVPAEVLSLTERCTEFSCLVSDLLIVAVWW